MLHLERAARVRLRPLPLTPRRSRQRSRPKEAAPGIATPAPAPPLPQARDKSKGVADIVFLVDVSGSMSTCIDALRKNIEMFIDSLSHGDANNAAPVKDWRGKVVGYRDLD